jgi:uncharacterized membrane protein YqiK
MTALAPKSNKTAKAKVSPNQTEPNSPHSPSPTLDKQQQADRVKSERERIITKRQPQARQNAGEAAAEAIRLQAEQAQEMESDTSTYKGLSDLDEGMSDPHG